LVQAVLTIDPDVFFLLSGTGQARNYPGMSWGNGFIVNQTAIQAYNLSDPTGFFEDIAAVPSLANRTILSVHVYGPNITVRACCACVGSRSQRARQQSIWASGQVCGPNTVVCVLRCACSGKQRAQGLWQRSGP
jgi:hypothetical protein